MRLNFLRTGLCLIILIVLSGCSGGAGGGSDSSIKSAAVISASQVETAKLQAAITADPVYKIDDSEISLLQKEGIITETDKAQLQAIQ